MLYLKSKNKKTNEVFSMSWEQVYQQWLNEENIPENLKNELKDLNTDPEKCEDAFYAPLEFGTAGMRGILGAGINRMNIFTVRQATEGLARFMDTQDPETKRRGVAIAYDSRHMSPEFAMEAAKTLAKHDIPSFVFESLRPTPELSFAVRYFKAFAGIMITASHNPAAYNGYKVYGEDGGQMPPADADALTKYVRSIENPLKIDVLSDEEVAHSGLINIVGEEVDNAYLKEIKTVTINQELINEMGKELKLVYTPLHGTGKMLGEKALKQAGFEKFVLVPEQAVADPDFTTVKSPNPEEHSAFEYAIRLGEKEGADLLIATDPDADRLGAAVRMPNGDYQVLTGNQLGSIMIHYILEAHQQAGTLPQNAAVLKSIVSSELATAIAEKYNTKMFNVLTGFKFIAEKIQQYEEDHSQTFMFGFEESYGYLVKPFVRDKDAIQALVLLAEVAAFYKKQGKTLYDGLQDIFEEFGYFEEKTISVTMSGIEGSGKIKALMAKCREQAPTEFAGIQVAQTEDFKELTRTFADGQTEQLQTPPSDVLKYHLEDGSWIAIRPSGTEPKIKFYLATKATSSSEASEKIAAFEAVVNELTK
ncbi:phosphoglucomutase/phosphomannomutase, alpha/beta/alpha domain II [Enterococcus faecalis ATCC 29200]|jgi:phosphoglucomutase|nr:phosphoglucomutase/phosphomannomutase, alpha/beta/alpha domain II [Enterococcus faecalis ATCC 29200]EFE16442.1 phosphoglucomutase/phosphomannomutase, alpha/beta/alpha domain II [Enterococcus faecalis R712]EFE20182.1 phosphoglucomutase/phosphomannomutase, alpha/beta/alpha domain II [Enterococcus faecalis S613]EFM70738.1 phosphoglucomutase/phosphomannomutase, alpha/beta/alpha domain II [Enterococcus faecalis TX0109]EFM71822.1 phosphoglucomutase/phosphomannomutase, alpha/beta/alpha domain II [E